MSTPIKTPPKAQKTLGFIDVVRFAAGYWRRQPLRLAIVMVMVTTGALMETYLPTTLSNFLAAVRQQEGEPAVIMRVSIFLGVYLVQGLIFVFTYRIYNIFETNIFKMLIDDAFAHVYTLPEHYFVNTFAGSIVSKISRGRQKIENFEDQILMRIFPTMLIMVGSILFLGMRFPMLAVLMIAYLILMTIVSAYYVFTISGPAQGEYAAAQDHYIAHLADNIGGVAMTKSYAQEEFELERYTDMTEMLRFKNARAYILMNTAALVQRLMLMGMLALMMGGGVWYLFHGQATIESMAYLAFAYTIIQSYIRDLGENIKNLLTSSYDLHAIILLFREKPEVPLEAKIPALNIKEGAIVFDKVGFAYPGKPEEVLKDFSVSIRSGERVALVGHSGSGKTTFVRLLQCLYEVQEGKICIDGQNIAKGSRFSLRNSIALVPQDPILFHRSLWDNIAYARPDATKDEIRAAARQAHIEAFIETLPQKYDTLVGERGIKLSGGERQRIAIARAILADRPILILDEATSSLDSESERAIQDALRTLTHGRTSIMIAHRLSTILDADRILVFDSGRIVEEGTHDQLASKDNGIYAGFFKLQAGGFIVED